MIRLTIKRKLPSANLWTNQRGPASSFIYRKERDIWYAMIRAVLTPQVPPPRLVKCRIVSYRTHLLDYGNLVGGAKMCPDCLRDLGYIKDDAPRWFKCEYEQIKVKAADVRTTIEIGIA